MPQPFFTIIVPVTERSSYLLPLTIESIAAQEGGSFEVLFINGTKLALTAPSLSHRGFRVLPAALGRRVAMMNQAIFEAKGDYLHFLSPGEFYISNHALSFMEKQIRAYGGPDLAYGGALLRRRYGQPEIFLQPIANDDLKGGSVPPSLHSYWLRKETLQIIGGFNEKFEVQPGLDLLCRIYVARTLRKIFVRRILTDVEYRRPPSKWVLRGLQETVRIVFFHFGFTGALFRLLWSNYLDLVRWWWKMVKTAFWREDAALR